MSKESKNDQQKFKFGEPWTRLPMTSTILGSGPCDCIGDIAGRERADRIIACVNACAGLGNEELKNPLISVGVLRNALQALGREQKAREKPGLDEELMEKPVEPGFCSISIDAKDMSKHVKAGALYKIVEALAKEWDRGCHFSELGEEAHHLINEIYWMDRKKR